MGFRVQHLGSRSPCIVVKTHRGVRRRFQNMCQDIAGMRRLNVMGNREAFLVSPEHPIGGAEFALREEALRIERSQKKRVF